MLGGPLGQGLGVIRAVPPVTGILDATDSPDTALFEGAAFTGGVLDATDAEDNALFLPEGAILGILDATEETPDDALFIGTSQTLGLLAADEEPDTAEFIGTVAWNITTGILAATDEPDTAFFYEGQIYDKVPSPVPKSPWDCLSKAPFGVRTFWVTQPDSCGEYLLCGYQCQIPGLQYEEVTDGRTIITVEWLRGLILNILNTRARSDLKCPTPQAIYGHWSESYREDQQYIGARFWNAAEKSYIRVADAVKAIGAMIKADLAKLVMLGVASKVDVTAVYGGSNTVLVTVQATAPTGAVTINLTGAMGTGGWVWR